MTCTMTTLVWREQSVSDAEGLLRREDVRMITITGPGGVGNTRLENAVAAMVADQYADGQAGWTNLKWPWFRLDDGQLTIEGRRVDGPGTFRADIPPMEAYPRDLNLAIGPGFIPSSLGFSAGGCWKVTAKFRDSKVVLYLDVTRAEPGRSPG